MAEVTFHVQKSKADWTVKLEGARCASAKCKTQEEALAKAKTLAKEQGLKEIVLHDGTTDKTVKV
jgi:hypothetical protein